MDITDEDELDILYTSEETDANVAYVNTHAQLEAMRDEALSLAMNPQGGDAALTNVGVGDANNGDAEGPRVLIVGPADSGKSSLARLLSSYAIKLSRTPILVDIDATQNMLSVPGTLAALPLTSESIDAESNATSTIIGGTSTSDPLVLWYGSTDLSSHPELYKAQITKLAQAIDARLSADVDARSSGIIVNTSGWIEEKGYEYILHAMEVMRINVVLVVGHDRLYSMLGTLLKKRKLENEKLMKEEQQQQQDQPHELQQQQKKLIPKLIKLPRSGGVVSRDASFRGTLRSQSIQRYFYGTSKPSTDPASSTTTSSTTKSTQQQHQYTPSLIELPLSTLTIYQLSNISLSSSMLPVSSKQSTDPIQCTLLPPSSLTTSFQQTLLAVCHPSAVEKYKASGIARDLYLSGVAGFVVVEKVDLERERVGVLCPCGGKLPSDVLLVGDVSWLE